MKTPDPVEQKVANFLMERGCLKMADALHCASELVPMIREGMVPAAELRELIQAWKQELETQWAMRNFRGFVVANDTNFARLETLLGEKGSK